MGNLIVIALVIIFLFWLIGKIFGGIFECIGGLIAILELSLGFAIIGAGLFFLFGGFSLSAASTGAIIGAVIGIIWTVVGAIRRFC